MVFSQGNSGVQYLADEYLQGEVFICSEGSLDISTADFVHAEFRRVLMRAARKLNSREWTRVYIVPFGPTKLSMQLKLLVHRICGIGSTDLMTSPASQGLTGPPILGDS